MSATISDHQIRVYEFARSVQGKWFTIQEAAIATNVRANTAKTHASRFETLGIFERLRLSPSHVFRLAEDAATRCPHMVSRLEEAVPVVMERRRQLLKREAQYLGEIGSDAEIEENVDRQQTTRDQSASPPGGVATQSQAEENSSRSRDDEVSKQRPQKKPRKADQIMAMLEQPNGASLDEIADAFGIKTHSARAVISVESRKRGVSPVLSDGRYHV